MVGGLSHRPNPINSRVFKFLSSCYTQLIMFKSKIFRSSVILGVFSFAASFVGLLRDRVFASQFGATRTLDIYYSAFKIPDLIFNLFILGAVSSAFIPVFIQHYRTDEKKAWRISQNFLNISFTAVIIACGIMILFIRPLATLVAPGFSGADRESVIQLMRLMLLSPIIFSVSTIIGSTLQALERFWAFAIAPILYNTGIIIGAIYFVPIMRAHGYQDVLGLGLGVILGASMHLVVQLVAAWRAGFRFGPIFDFSDENFKSIMKLMIPRTIGLGAYSIDSAIINALASMLGAGSIAMLNFANNLQFVPISVVGISAAIAVFPRLSFHASGDERVEFKKKLNAALKGTALIVTAGAVVLFFMSEWVIRILFGVGLFHGQSITITAGILSLYMLGVTAQSLIPILSRAFYALKHTRTPVIISLISIAVNVSLASFFTFYLHWDVRGLALSFAIAGNVNFFLLWVSFKKFFDMLE